MRNTESGLFELWSWTSTPRPSCPNAFEPQQRIWPVVVIAHVFDPPAAMVSGAPTSSLREQHPRPLVAMHSTSEAEQAPEGRPPSGFVAPSGSMPLEPPP